LKYLTTTLCEASPHALVTIEYGSDNTHEHANFLFYSKHRDAFNLRRFHKWKLPEYKVKAVSSINNVISYMTKEGKPSSGSVLVLVGGWGGFPPTVLQCQSNGIDVFVVASAGGVCPFLKL